LIANFLKLVDRDLVSNNIKEVSKIMQRKNQFKNYINNIDIKVEDSKIALYKNKYQNMLKVENNQIDSNNMMKHFKVTDPLSNQVKNKQELFFTKVDMYRTQQTFYPNETVKKL
jgi:hypothetical protein